MNRRNAALLASAALLLAGCGNAARTRSQVAAADVCNARNQIGTDVAGIQATVVSPGTPLTIAMEVNDIRAKLLTIGLAQRALPPAVGLPVRRAAVSFAVASRPIATGLRLAPAGEVSLPRYALFTTAQKKLGPVYTSTLGALPC
jgi:hypothetical protein